MAFAEDLTLFFDDTEFAVAATATTRLGASLQFKVIFDAPHLDGFGASGMEALQPSARAASTDVHDLAQNDPITIAGQAYVIGSLQPDGTGVTRIFLERAP